MPIGIISTGLCVGENIQTNKQLEQVVKNFNPILAKSSLDEWYSKHYGINTRVKTNKQPSDLAVSACKEAIKNAGIDIQRVDFLILNTTTGDFKQPTTATKVQTALGMRKDSFALEINMPCAGNIYGLAVTNGFIKTGLGSYGLVVGVDKMSTNIDEEEFVLSGMFGDAASAALVGPNCRFEFGAFYLGSEGDKNQTLIIPSSGSAIPLSKESIDNKDHLLKMNGKATEEFIARTVRECVEGLLSKSNCQISDVDQLILHQASKPILERVTSELGFNQNQLFFTVEKYGNTSSASILLTLHEYLNQAPKQSRHIFLVGMGSGLNWGGLYLKGL
jgi:3-oxoacyl-[acyl-carrier-protein] synthase III